MTGVAKLASRFPPIGKRSKLGYYDGIEMLQSNKTNDFT